MIAGVNMTIAYPLQYTPTPGITMGIDRIMETWDAVIATGYSDEIIDFWQRSDGGLLGNICRAHHKYYSCRRFNVDLDGGIPGVP
jgi:hypothetical protein